MKKSKKKSFHEKYKEKKENKRILKSDKLLNSDMKLFIETN